MKLLQKDTGFNCIAILNNKKFSMGVLNLIIVLATWIATHCAMRFHGYSLHVINCSMHVSLHD